MQLLKVVINFILRFLAVKFKEIQQQKKYKKEGKKKKSCQIFLYL